MVALENELGPSSCDAAAPPSMSINGSNEGGDGGTARPPPKDALHDDAFRVKFEDGDPIDPQNFSAGCKAWILAQTTLLSLAVTLASSIIAPVEPYLVSHFDVSREVTVLAFSLFLLGYAFGPLLWGPISEVYGRRSSMLPGILLLGVFSIGTGASNTFAGIMILRFLSGVIGVGPAAIAPASIRDYYSAKTGGLAMSFISVAISGAPTVAPVISAAILSNPHLNWRWPEYMQGIISFAIFAVTLPFFPETYPPVLLARKAKALRATTGDDRYWHPHEHEKINPSNAITKYLSRPLRMFLTDPMVLCITLYTSFIYALIFLFLEVFPVVFADQRGYGLVVSTTPFLAILVGLFLSIPINLANGPRYNRAVESNGGQPVPEARLAPMLVGGILLSGGLFAFAWTAAPQYHWILPVIGATMFGCGFNVIFVQSLNFLVDSHTLFAASVVSGNTIVRSLVAAGLPLAARPMLNNMGVSHAMTLLGGISCLALPMPLVFMRYGAALRAQSKYSGNI